MTPTPTINPDLAFRRADFSTLPEALDYAAKGVTGVNFYSARCDLVTALPFAQMRDRAVEMARSLIQAGFEKRSCVVLLGDTDPDIMTAFFACQYASLIPVIVPIPASLGGRDAYVASLKRLIASSKATVAMAPEAYLGFLKEAVGDEPNAPTVGTPAEFAALPGSAV